MNNLKKGQALLITILATVAIIVVGAVIFSSKNSDADKNSNTPPIVHQYFWSETCPHCANVAEFMESWEGKDKLEIEKFEINQNSDSRSKFYSAGILCKIPQTELGVPLLVTPEGKCFNGDVPIIEYFEGMEFEN